MTYTIPKIYTYWFRVFFVGIGMVAEKLVKGKNNFPSNFYNSHIAAPFIVNGNPIQSSSKSKQKFLSFNIFTMTDTRHLQCFWSIPWSSISDRYPCNND